MHPSFHSSSLGADKPWLLVLLLFTLLTAGALLLRGWLGLWWRAVRVLRRHCDGPRWRPTLKMAWFALSHPRATGAWLRYLHAPGMAALVHAHPRLLDKAQRPYMNRRLPPHARVRALVSHYDWLQRSFTAQAIRQFYSRQPVALARVASPGGSEDLVLGLGYGEVYEREGELTLSLRLCTSEAPQGDLVAVLVFSVTQLDGRRLMRICCVQGCGDTENAARIKQATKLLHGLRPKALLVRMAQVLATRWQAGLQGIDPREHPFAGLRYRFSRRKRFAIRHMLASYGGLWAEFGGQLAPGGWHALAAAPHSRPLSEVPSRKRSQYARRYALLESMEQQLGARLAVLQRDPQAWLAPRRCCDASHSSAIPVRPTGSSEP